jgi:hypothetical protein
METICNEPVGTQGLTGDCYPAKQYPAKQWWVATATKLIGNYKTHSVEQKLAIGTNWKKAVLDKYWQPYRKEINVLFQGKLDLVCLNDVRFLESTEARIVDWKSGKVRKSELKMCQLASQALLLFSNFEKLEKITASYIWLEHKTQQTKVFERADLPEMRDSFGIRFELIYKALFGGENYFLPNYEGNCHWCPATREHCRYAR